MVDSPDAFPGSSSQIYAGYHGYWPSQPRATQRRFGSLDELKAAVAAACHALAGHSG